MIPTDNPSDNNTTQANENEKKQQYVDAKSSFHFTENTADVESQAYREFVIHVFCLSGSASVVIGEKKFELVPNNCLVLLNNNIFKWLETSPDFRMRGVFISNDYMSNNSPDVNYSTINMLYLMDNPILTLSQGEMNLCLSVCEAIRNRITQTDHMFYEGVLRRCVETLVLDIYNFQSHSEELHKQNNGNQGLRFFRIFISMLEKGNYRQQREVRWYSAKMGITAKYLSEVCINSSGHGASYWINKFTTQEIARLLHNPTMSINSIADLMNFTTRSYFSHYVKERLGLTPKDYRLKVLGVK